jgi:hypothetical protein
MLGLKLSSQILSDQVLLPSSVFTAVFGMGTGVFLRLKNQTNSLKTA